MKSFLYYISNMNNQYMWITNYVAHTTIQQHHTQPFFYTYIFVYYYCKYRWNKCSNQPCWDVNGMLEILFETAAHDNNNNSSSNLKIEISYQIWELKHFHNISVSYGTNKIKKGCVKNYEFNERWSCILPFKCYGKFICKQRLSL